MQPIDRTTHAPSLASSTAPQATSPMDVIRLPRNGSRHLRAPLDLRVLDGTLWLTVDGQSDDLLLEPGMSARLEVGRVLAFALGGPARLAVREAPAAGLPALWQRLRTWLTGDEAPLSSGAAGVVERPHAGLRS